MTIGNLLQIARLLTLRRPWGEGGMCEPYFANPMSSTCVVEYALKTTHLCDVIGCAESAEGDFFVSEADDA